MIVSSFLVVGTQPLVPTFYAHSTCANCAKPIFRPVDDSGYEWVWVHTSNESAYCRRQFAGFNNYEDVNPKAAPVFGPTNFELMWQ